MSERQTSKRVGWVEPFAKPIIFANRQLMGIASLHPSYEPERTNARASLRAEIHFLVNGCLQPACLLAR